MENFRTEIKWSIIFTLVMLLWMVAERFTGLHSTNIEYHYIVTNFFVIVAVLVYVFALLEKRKKDFGGKMNWIQGFISGLILTLGIIILTPFAQYITVEVITPDYFKNMIAYVIEKGEMSREQAEAAFNLRSYMIQSVMSAPLMGLFTSAIVAIFTRKK
ncbi:DUF4199 domain-containing protein [Maribellus sp. YY47]|uniref:DUF4199 domain-containing protein n=1 Tax=Maribellus sp. YY47 TaxID=2929486 RepID=UPI002001BEC0|nr:DUF4199 domain-containing protein [Maribellus sp. YY47]MCK3684783.1 DUF4199 domain-containing protein [Maribellus sp. YY47]